MFNDKIRELRKGFGVSQEELAEKLGVTRQAVTKWESGSVLPDILNVIKLSELFKVSIDSLVKEECSDGSLRVQLDMRECQSFVHLAKRHTYGANGPQETLVLRHGSKDYRFQEGDYHYHDSYVGNEVFVGEELVYHQQRPLWALAYSGKVLSDRFSSSFLKEALMRVPRNSPFRGPNQYSKGSYHYYCQTEGDFEWFQGKEIIYYEQEKVFELYISMAEN